MADVAMPRLSDSMEEGTILKWLKADGEEVRRGEELVEIETDKANMTYEADEAGVLSIVAQEGDTLAVGEPIARIGEGASGGAASGGADESGGAEASDGSGDAGAAAPPAPQAAAEEEPQPAAAEPATPAPAASGNGHPAAAPEPAPAPAPAGASNGSEAGNGRLKASPVARRMARELGLELSVLQGTGPGGRIVKADVEAASAQAPRVQESSAGTATTAAPPAAAQPAPAAAAPAPPPPPVDAPDPGREAAVPDPAREPEVAAPVSGDGRTGRGEITPYELSRLQQTVARRMAESRATAPDFVVTVEVDMEEAVAFRRQLKAAAGDAPAPSYNDFVIKASALALRDFPRVNGAYRDGRFELYGRVNIGLAVTGQDALMVPTVYDADSKSLGQIAREARELAERVRTEEITPPELASGTFTISNLGMFGVKRFTAVINPPQSAILAVGEMTPRPVVREGEVVVRHVMELTLACDHRILYGADAARFIAKVRERLENPLSLAL